MGRRAEEREVFSIKNMTFKEQYTEFKSNLETYGFGWAAFPTFLAMSVCAVVLFIPAVIFSATVVVCIWLANFLGDL